MAEDLLADCEADAAVLGGVVRKGGFDGWCWGMMWLLGRNAGLEQLLYCHGDRSVFLGIHVDSSGSCGQGSGKSCFYDKGFGTFDNIVARGKRC